MKFLLMLLPVLVLAGCSGAPAPTATPTKTPMPTWTATPDAPTATVAPVTPEAPTATSVPEAAPVSLEAMGQAMGAALLDSELDAAMQRAIDLGPGNMTADQLSFAVLAVLRRAPSWMDTIGSGAAVDDRAEVLLDACQQIAYTASLRTDNLTLRNALADLATGCTAVRMDAIGGTVRAESLAAVRSAVERANVLLAP